MAVNVRVANNAFGQLASSVSTSETTISLEIGNAERFPTLTGSQYFYATMANSANQLEIVKVTAVNADNFTVLRAQDGTTAKEFDAGDRIELRPVAALFEDYIEGAIEEVQDSLGTMADQNANAVAITGGSIDATIAYDNNASGLTATNVQQAIDETNTRFASLSGRNRIINGGMDVWQRGTSITVGSEDTYTVDRWTAREGVVSQSTDVPANQGFKYSLFYDNDGTRTAINIRQKIEDGKVLLENIPVTLSFWAKGSINATISVDWTDTNTTNLSLTTSWQRFEVSFPATAINPNNIFSGSAWVDFNFGASYPDVRLTGVQLEVGSVATPFERRPYGTELALCQRYFEKSFNVEVAPANGVSTPDRRQGISYQSTRIGYQEQFKIPKRANPSMVLFRGSASSTDNQWGYFNGSGWVTMPTHGTNIRQNEFRIDFVVTGRAVGQAWILDGNWTASAEL